MPDDLIPDEAWAAADEASELPVAVSELTLIVRAAAPHIARAAQVAILQRMATRLDTEAKRDEKLADGLRVASMILLGEIVDMNLESSGAKVDEIERELTARVSELEKVVRMLVSTWEHRHCYTAHGETLIANARAVLAKGDIAESAS